MTQKSLGDYRISYWAHNCESVNSHYAVEQRIKTFFGWKWKRTHLCSTPAHAEMIIKNLAKKNSNFERQPKDGSVIGVFDSDGEPLGSGH